MDELKLNKIVDEVIDNKTSHSLKGGVARGGCQCGCCYEGRGGSSYHDNGAANLEHGYHSPCPSPDQELPEVIITN
ncbi:TIGR04149 family rSAM-modified RiPP [Porphyromonas levii]|uniref:TIGR04149 family rSAM-modified RiPP n=1 Tax=Porphyromonas levii TaxID=28114 RepID=UPI003FA153D3